MGFSSKHALKLISLGWIGLATAKSLPKIHTTQFAPGDIITRDVCIIGGGATGTYAATRLRDMNQTIVVVEAQDRLGGHTETYTNPATGQKIDYGVVVWHDLPVVRDWFARFDVPLIRANFSDAIEEYVDFRTGELVNHTYPANISEGLAAYSAQLTRYPYLEAGFYLPDPVPEDLLLPFGDFIQKYLLSSVARIIFEYGQGLGDLLAQPTLYIFKNFGPYTLRDLQIGGFLTTARHDNSELYKKARARLGDDVLLNTRIVMTDRKHSDYALVEVSTPSGLKLIRAKKLLLTIPPKLNNLAGFDLSASERCLFAQFRNSAYYTGVLNHTGLPNNLILSNAALDTPYNLPPLPGVNAVYPTNIAGLHRVTYSSPLTLPDAQVQANIIASVQRLQLAGTLETTEPSFAAYASHTPFELTVGTEAIREGFYRQLYRLQGKRRTWWTGAAWHTHDSSLLWQFTEALLPQIIS